MHLTKDQIDAWLKRHSRDRQWLAEKLAVSKGTVDQWFSKGFSESALAGIRLLKQLDTPSASDDTALIQFTTAEFEAIEHARRLVGMPERPKFYRDAILYYVDDLQSLAQPQALPTPQPRDIAAEDPPP